LKLSQTFIPLPFSFDAEKLAEEALALPDYTWMPHPSGMVGNSAVPLISVGGGDNNHFHGKMSVTPHLEKSPYHQQVLASFNEILGRSRLMKLAPGAEVAEHIDGDYHWLTRVRIHVPIITDPDVIFHCADTQMHMKAGDCWIFDAWERHKVVNNSSVTRIHLVFDTSGSSRFWNMVRDMEAHDHLTNLADLGEKIKWTPYEEGKSVTVSTENYNVSPVMAPGEMDALIDELIVDFDGNPTNDPVIANTYKRFLMDFAKDWRQAWLTYGYSEEGWPHYQSLVKELQGKLQRSNHDAVKLKSNDLSANLIIIKRLILPAFNIEVLKDFMS
jgi:aspartyl/asparaginyl beta-hydroxylase